MADTCCACSFQDTAYLAGSCAPSFAIFMGLLDYLLQTQCGIADPCGRAGNINLKLEQDASFDYIVVGAGVAGSVVASRLAELNATVLLIEAGPEEPSSTQVPGFAFNALGTPVDWNYTTQVESKACLSTGGICAWPRGKMVGGTFPLNGMMYSRGHPKMFDQYAADGNVGWAFEDVLPYYKKAESNRNPELIDDGYHGFDGPLVVQRFSHHPEISKSIIEAGHELGYRDGDFSGKNQTGLGLIQVMVSDGLRGSTSRMYLRKTAKTQSNIQVLVNSQVTRVVLGSSGEATGVEYMNEKGELKIASAREEVILSAGAIGSPQILLLSGIGPRSDLKKLGIKVHKDLPVGKNLRNHVGTAVRFRFNDSSEQQLTLDAFKQYIQNRGGPLASTGLTQLTGFFLSSHAKDGIQDLQIFLDGYSTACARTGLEQECENGNFGFCGKRAITARPTNIVPRSKGCLKLKSKDPLDHPLIYANYFDEDIDANILLDGIKIAKSLFLETQALRAYGFEIDESPAPGCENYQFDSEKYWRCAIQRYTGPENHQSGTCKMGPKRDSSAVVDPQLRVYGIPNLRVIDASIFPLLPNGNPVSSIIMVAEKGSDMIKDTWLSKKSNDK